MQAAPAPTRYPHSVSPARYHKAELSTREDLLEELPVPSPVCQMYPTPSCTGGRALGCTVAP